MRIANSGLMLAALMLVLGWGMAATDDAVKVGFVDIDQVLATAEEGKSAREELERKSRDAQGRLGPIAEQIEALQKELQAKQFVMSEDAVRSKQLDLVELQNRYETKIKEEEGQFKIDQQRLINPLIEKLGDVMKEVGRDNGFSVILRNNAPSIVYAREALDITDLVIQKFNGKN
ncbi:MAG TPA: OmpH family outer membrane protein [Myxococcales bacterium]|nr:OmpH family outer membrane protein [Myxococcales bacterium]HIK86733.1 OmpH family outer membrane protein [Myxococcales bacterium]